MLDAFTFFFFLFFFSFISWKQILHSSIFTQIKLTESPYSVLIHWICSLFSLIISSSIHFISLIPPRLSNSVTFKLILLTFTQILNQESFHYIQTKHSNYKSKKKPLLFPSLSLCLVTHLTTLIFSFGRRWARDFIPLGFLLEQETDGTTGVGHSLM